AVRARLRRSIRDDVAAHGLDPDRYLHEVATRDQVLQGLLNRVTVQETSFFRHPEHFSALADDILPNLAGPVTLWSAGCANGQEAYSLAMILDELGVDGSVIATDVSTSALERTTAGRYADRELAGLSRERIGRHLDETADGWQIKPHLRDRVRIARHNLLDPVPQQAASSQVVFCRNVLIYFSATHMRGFLDRVADALPHDGTLFLGAAESVWQVSDRFETIGTGDTFLYRTSKRASTGPHAAPVVRPLAPRRSRGPAHADPVTSIRQGRLPASAARRLEATDPISPSTSTAAAAAQADAGQRAMAAGDHDAAITAFRRCIYLGPGDPIAHLNLGLAFDAAGREPAARRAYAVARRVLLDADPSGIAGDGYEPAELLKLLDHREQVPS
ncbi:MAG: hypothetical protein JWO57_3014, partial [Pseudonocardiales bacterium]|nr:hypothetical protein [Pseudonocardiales bacterium]